MISKAFHKDTLKLFLAQLIIQKSTKLSGHCKLAINEVSQGLRYSCLSPDPESFQSQGTKSYFSKNYTVVNKPSLQQHEENKF